MANKRILLTVSPQQGKWISERAKETNFTEAAIIRLALARVIEEGKKAIATTQ